MTSTRLIIIMCTLVISLQTQGQQMFMEIGRVNTTFQYTNSKGESALELFPDKSFAYAVGFRKGVNEKLHVLGAAVYNRYSNYGSDDKFNNSYRWETGYAGILLGADIEFFKKRGFSAFIRGAIEPQILLSGTQQINDDVFEIKGVEQFDSPLLFLKGGAGINWCVDTKVAVQFKYIYGLGKPFKSSADGEKLNLATSTINLGLVWSLRKCDYCHNKKYQAR